MAEKIKDAEDRLLESLFASPPVADDGFSDQIVGKLRRRLWARRLIVPLAGIIGGIVAFKPLTGLITLLAKLPALIPSEIVNGTTSSLPQFSTLILGALLLAACFVGVRILED